MFPGILWVNDGCFSDIAGIPWKMGEIAPKKGRIQEELQKFFRQAVQNI